MDDAARWWVDLNRRLPTRKQTWPHLKRALLRRYGEQLDKSAAEWRVKSLVMMPGETYADFAAGLRAAARRNHVNERVFLAQFYRCLDKTTRQLVMQPTKPKTLERAVAKATRIDGPYENVAQEMVNIGQQWATAPTSYLIPMIGPMGHTAVIPGIGAMTLPTEAGSTVANAVAVEPDAGSVALFTNPQGVWNNYTGTWEQPAGRVWNGKYWSESKKKGFRKKSVKSSTYHESKKPGTKQKSRRERNESDDDTAAGPPPRRKLKAAARVVTAKDESSYQPTTTAGARSEKKCGPQSGVARCFKGIGLMRVQGTRRATRAESGGISPVTSPTLKRGHVTTLKRRSGEHEPIGDQQRSVEERRVRRSREMVQALREVDDRERSGRRDCERVANDERRARVRLNNQSYEDTHVPHGSERVVKYVCADDGLPTAMMEVEGNRRAVKFDSCARYSVVGTGWMQYGERLNKPPPVDYVEGIGGITLVVIGIWEFELKTTFNDVINVKACVVKGCKEEFLLGVDFMQEHGATIDFKKHKVRYRRDGHTVVIPFRTRDEGHGTGTAAVRMAYTTRLEGRTVTPVEVAVSVVDGERGIFAPGLYKGAVMLATTVTTAKDGYALVPAINASVESVKLPSKRELGTWIPLSDDMTVLEMKGQLRSERVHEWLDSLGDTTTPIGE
ncbi:hypothetical protein PHMEG_0009459 [Phytophthora megakarya]|uniref:Retrotransposon gag domain-containing protein n=1 Tax=Phytophthora megakarya TaxID=4795 RepID=A0A225WHK4_9STRA|nr:hypothetical protein PHMEG_0009459 [Phytophthora megakarya]